MTNESNAAVKIKGKKWPVLKMYHSCNHQLEYSKISGNECIT